jgi:hypothetical protein
MRWFVIFFGISQICNASPGLDPCRFVGFRFGKAESTCGNGTCSGFIRKAGSTRLSPVFKSTDGIPVSCEEAGHIMNEYFRTHGPSKEVRPFRNTRSVPLEIQTALDSLLTTVVPAIGGMLFLRTVIDEEVRRTMRSIDEAFIGHLRQPANREMLRSSIVSSPGFHELERLWKETLNWSGSVPLAIDVDSGFTAPFLHFYLDLFSILDDRVEMRSCDFSLYLPIVAGNQTGYRPDFEEFEFSGIPKSSLTHPPNALRLAESIYRVTANPGDSEAASCAIVLISRLASSDASPATQALLGLQVVSEFCPLLANILTIGKHHWSRAIKLTVSALAHCRGAIPESVLIQASLSLWQPRGGHDLLREPLLGPLVNEVVNLAFPWSDGFDPSVDQTNIIAYNITKEFFAVTAPFVSVRGLQLFRRKSSYQSRGVFEIAMRGLGRTIGLCIRYNGPCRELIPLSDDILQTIFEAHNSESLRQSMNLDEIFSEYTTSIEENILQFIYEPIFFVRIGIRDILGPPGVFALYPNRPTSTYI